MLTKDLQDELIRKVKGDGLVGRSVDELAMGFLRYETLRRLNARQFHDLCKRNLNGERFDDIVDDLIPVTLRLLDTNNLNML